MKSWHRFIFLRHGQTDWNFEGRFQGQADTALNAKGVSQAEDAADRLAQLSIDRVVSSPLIRALKTAAIVAERVNLPVHIDSQIAERGFGSFEGLVIADVKRQHGLALSEPAARILPPDAEHWPQTLTRSQAVVSKWLEANPGETILFVAHDGIFRALSELLLGSWFESKNGTPYAFAPGPDGWSVSEVESGN